MQLRNRNPRPDLVLLQSANEPLLAALRAVMAPLPNRSVLDSVNRIRFGELNRADRAPLVPFRIDQEMLRAVSRAAAADGTPAVITAVREKIQNYFDARCADALAELPAEAQLDVVTAYLGETAAQAPVEPAQAVAATMPALVNLERASETSKSYRRKLDTFINACDRTISQLRQHRAHARAL